MNVFDLCLPAKHVGRVHIGMLTALQIAMNRGRERLTADHVPWGTILIKHCGGERVLRKGWREGGSGRWLWLALPAWKSKRGGVREGRCCLCWVLVMSQARSAHWKSGLGLAGAVDNICGAGTCHGIQW